jgi:thioredoxin-like negative regulator of GroEL
VVVLDTGPAADNGKDHNAPLLPVREALAQGDFEKAAATVQQVIQADPLLPEARRLLGICQAALGRFRGAAETWKSWSRLGTRTPAEEALAPEVERLRQAAEILAEELESYRD